MRQPLILLRTTPHPYAVLLDPQLDSSLQVPQGEVQSVTHDKAHKTGKNYLSVLFSIHFCWSIVALQCASFNCRQRESAIPVPMSLFFGFPCHLGHHRVLSRVPYAT